MTTETPKTRAAPRPKKMAVADSPAPSAPGRTAGPRLRDKEQTARRQLLRLKANLKLNQVTKSQPSKTVSPLSELTVIMGRKLTLMHLKQKAKIKAKSFMTRTPKIPRL